MIGFFLLWVLLATPATIAVVDKWSFSSAFFFTIQAGLGIGFGEMNVTSAPLKWLMLVQLILGSFLVASIVATVLARLLKQADEAAAVSAASPLHEFASAALPWRGFAVACMLLGCVLLAGVLYGLLYEGWDLVTSLLFVFSACQSEPEANPRTNARI